MLVTCWRNVTPTESSVRLVAGAGRTWGAVCVRGTTGSGESRFWGSSVENTKGLSMRSFFDIWRKVGYKADGLREVAEFV